MGMDLEEILPLSEVVAEIPSLSHRDKPMLSNIKKSKNFVSVSIPLMELIDMLKDQSQTNGSMDLEEILPLSEVVPEIPSLSHLDKPMLSNIKKSKNFVSVSIPLMELIDMLKDQFQTNGSMDLEE